MHSPVTAGLRLMGFLTCTLVVVPPYALLLGLGQGRLCRHIACFYWRTVLLLLGFKVIVHGRPCDQRPALFVSNHASYLDIVVLGSLLPAVFVAKQEVSTWPGFGVIAKLGRTVFIDRRPRKSMQHRDQMITRLLDSGESVILFPEGTSNDGNRVLPFKSALLSVAEVTLPSGSRLPVQPVSVAYTRLDGMPIGRGWRPLFAWYGDMDLAPHLWEVLGLGRTTVEVQFHEPTSIDQFGSRKELTDHCHKVIRTGVVGANAGRIGPLVESGTAG